MAVQTTHIAPIPQSGASAIVSRALLSGRVWVIQGVGTLLWLGLALSCFQIGVRSLWRVVLATILVIPAVAICIFVQRSAVRIFRQTRLATVGRGKPAVKFRRRKTAEWIPDAAIVFVLLLGLAGWNAVILQSLPIALEESEITELVLLWILFIVFWLPPATAALLAERGMWRAAMSAWRLSGYWLGTFLAVALPALVFLNLQDWIWPGGGAGQGTPAGRAVGYVLGLGAWLVLLAIAEDFISRGDTRPLDETWH